MPQDPTHTDLLTSLLKKIQVAPDDTQLPVKEVRDLLTAELHLFKSYFDSLPLLAYHISLEGVIIDINQCAVNRLGYEGKDELLGKPLVSTIYAPTSRPKARQLMERWRREGKLTNEEMQVITKQGEIIDVLLYVDTIYDINGAPLYSFSTHIDITAQKQAEESLRHSEERHRSMLENLGEGIASADWKERFTYSNPAADRIFGVPVGTLVGRNLKEFLTPKNIKIVRKQTASRKLGVTSSYETEIVRLNGEKRQVAITATPQFDENGVVVGSLGFFSDITERKRSQEAIQHLNRVLRAIRNVNQLIVHQKDRRQLIQQVCNLLTETGGYYSAWIALLTDDEVVQAVHSGLDDSFAALQDYFHSGRLPGCARLALKRRHTVAIDDSNICGDCPLLESKSNGRTMTVRIEHLGKIYGMLSTHIPSEFAQEKEERRLLEEVAGDLGYALYGIETEEKRRSAEIRYQTLVENAFAGIYLIRGRHYEYVNPRFCEVVGYSREELTAPEFDFSVTLTDEAKQVVEARYQARLRGEPLPERYELKLVKKSGEKIDVAIRAVPIRTGEEVVVMGLMLDITESKHAENLLRIQRDLGVALSVTVDIQRALEIILDAGLAVEGIDAGGIYVVNPQTDALELKVHKGLPSSFIEQFSRISRDAAFPEWALKGEPVYAYHPALLKAYDVERETDVRGVAIIPVLSGGELFAAINFVSFSFDDIPTNSRTILEAIASEIGDVVARLRAEASLREAEERYRVLLNNAPLGIAMATYEGRNITCNYALVKITGYSLEETTRIDMGKTYRNTEEHQRFLEQVRHNRFVDGWEVERIRKDGTAYFARITASPITFRGEEVILIIMEDVTERRRLGEQMQHLAKMESIGRLASGIAHDFKNRLAVIKGNLDLLLEHTTKDHPHYELISDAYMASKALDSEATRLRTFSRKGELRPEIVNLNSLISSIKPMIQHSAGANSQLELLLAPTVKDIKVDRVQLENVIFNLAGNAGDAMPEGGKLIIETRDVELDERFTRFHPNITPGSYVKLAVSDTGIGIPEQEQLKIFEPFYTTKPEGKGTGLGLANAYGFVLQSRGDISVESQVGVGSRFTLYLPAAEEQASATPQ